jgi:hypothetical protein
LIDRGHEVIGTLTSSGNADRVRALGAEPVALDLLDPRAAPKAVLSRWSTCPSGGSSPIARTAGLPG